MAPPPEDPNKIFKEILNEIRQMRQEARQDRARIDLNRLSPQQRVLLEKQAAAAGFNNASDMVDAFDAENVEEFIRPRYKAIQNQGGGAMGFARRIMEAQLPDPREAIGIYGYQQSIKNTRAAKVYAFAEMVRESAARYMPPGHDPYIRDDSGKAIAPAPYSSGRVNDLSRAERSALYQTDEYHGRVLGMSSEGLSAEEQEAHRQFLESHNILIGPEPISDADRATHTARRDAAAAVLGAKVLARGASLKEFAGAGEAARSAAGRLAGTSTFAGKAAAKIFSASGLVMGAARLAGPVGLAVSAADTGYRVADSMYGPTREGASLGYGFSYNPFGYGAQVAMGRRLENKATALLSFGINSQQTAAAQQALQGIGVGGPGSEREYNSYYRSMTDVIKGTQLDAGDVAPFYEQMRRGGQSNEIGELTKMLRIDLPRAAAAARMSMRDLASSIAATSEAVYNSPLNSRSRFDISQTILSSMNAGAPKGTEGIAAGENDFLAARVASANDMGFLEARTQGGLMQAEAAKVLVEQIGTMTGKEFHDWSQTPEGRMQIPILSEMTGLGQEQMQQLYNKDINKYIAAQEAANDLDESKFWSEGEDNSKSGVKKIGEGLLGSTLDSILPGLGTGLGARLGWGRGGEDTRKTFLPGTEIDIYKSQGKVVKDYFEKEGTLDDIRSGLNPEELEKFEKDMAGLMGENKGDELLEFLRKTTNEMGGQTDKENGPEVLGLFDLSDDAKKLLKFTAAAGAPQKAISEIIDWGSTTFDSAFGG